MSAGLLRTAVIVTIELPDALERIRRVGDPMAGLNVPAHVTLLFPFVPRDTIDDGALERVSAIVGRETRFDVEFGRVGRFPPTDDSPDGVLWLAPEPAGPIVRLTEALVAGFPGYAPYGGLHREVIPHLTMATLDGARFDEVAAAISAHLPIRQSVAEASLLVEDPSGRWSSGERFSFR